MADQGVEILLCDCEGSVKTDPGKMCAACPGAAGVHTSLCRTQTDVLAKALSTGPVIVACAQEEGRFIEVAEEMGVETLAGAVDIRDRALWSEEADRAAPKTAALMAEANRPGRAAGTVDVESEGVCLVYGASAVVLPLAETLSRSLTVTAMLTDGGDVMLPWDAAFEVARGTIRNAGGTLGAFEIVADGVAMAIPGGRGALGFEEPRDGGKSVCDMIVDVSGRGSLFTAHGKRDGYLRADPGDSLAVAGLVPQAMELVGTFEKTLYIDFHADLCAHSRSGQPGCTRCLEVCPTGAIVPNGETVKIDPMGCAGCGGCAAVCPSGAAEYKLPLPDDARMRMEVMLTANAEAGGEAPRILIHDERDGRALIAAAARYGRGLPATVIPFAVNEVTQVGHDLMMGAFGMGAGQVTVHMPERIRREGEEVALEAQVALARAMLEGVGQEAERIVVVETDDPDTLSEALYADAPDAMMHEPVSPVGDKRTATRLSITALAPEGAIFELPEGAPYGEVVVNQGACTLCLACVSQCPVGALMDNPDKPQLRFRESACLQCGICESTCPENAIALQARFDPSPEARNPRVLNEDEPALCVECNKPFGSRGTIERIIEKLGGAHWMFDNPERTRVIRMCDDCRVDAVFRQEDNPFKMGEKPPVRTTEDYLDADSDEAIPKRKFDA